MREKTSDDPAGKNSENSVSSKKTGDKDDGADEEDSENNQDSDLITSTIEETECDWEYAHVITLVYRCLYKKYLQNNICHINILHRTCRH